MLWLQAFLLLLIGDGHSGEPFIADLSAQVIFVKPLDDTIPFRRDSYETK